MTDDDQNHVRAIVREEIAASEARLTETMRDMQTEILRGLESFARGNFARMHRLETRQQASQDVENAIVERINALEERVLALETRHNT